MIVTYTDHYGDKLAVHAIDNEQYVTFEVLQLGDKLRGGVSGMVDVDAKAVDDIIHALTEWRKLNP